MHCAAVAGTGKYWDEDRTDSVVGLAQWVVSHQKAGVPICPHRPATAKRSLRFLSSIRSTQRGLSQMLGEKGVGRSKSVFLGFASQLS